MSVRIYTLDEAEKWDAAVTAFRHTSVHYLSSYGRAFAGPKNGTPHLFYYRDGQCCAAIVYMLRDISFDPYWQGKLEAGIYFDIITPYGYGGMLTEGEDPVPAMEAFRQYCQERGIISEFVRFHLFSGAWKHFDGVVETRQNNIVRDLSIDFDRLWLDVAHKVRKNYKKAVQAGLEIRISDGRRDLRDFLEIYHRTMKRKQAREEFYFPETFFRRLHHMEDNVIYFDAVLDSRTVSTELVLYDRKNCYSFLGGTLEESFSCRPNDFLKIKIIKWAQEKGLENFVLGGGYGADDGIFRYKKALAPHGERPFYIGKKVIRQDMYDRLTAIRLDAGLLSGGHYFPAYRGSP